jgi:hypothetical protein
MPVLKYTDGKNEFKIEGGCLAVMGRCASAAENINCLITTYKLDGVTKVTFNRILQLPPTTSTIRYLSVMDKYMSMFPFMQCVITSNSDILKTKDCTFDVENYTQNEVMHAMFHVRMLAYATIGIVHKGSTMIEALYKLTEDGLPFWKAYLLCTAPMGITFKYRVSPVLKNVLEADANTYCLNRLPLSNFLSLLRGERPEPIYQGGTILENAKARQKYAQNISSYLESATSLIKEPTLSDFFVSLAKTAQANTVKHSATDAFGHLIAREEDGYDVTDSGVIAALDVVLTQYEVNEENLIC